MPLPFVCHCARRYADVLIKNLSSSATLAVLIGLSALLFGTPLTHEKVAGSIVIICTSYIYVLYAHKVVQEGEACVGVRRICAHIRKRCFTFGYGIFVDDDAPTVAPADISLAPHRCTPRYCKVLAFLAASVAVGCIGAFVSLGSLPTEGGNSSLATTSRSNTASMPKSLLPLPFEPLAPAESLTPAVPPRSLMPPATTLPLPPTTPPALQSLPPPPAPPPHAPHPPWSLLPAPQSLPLPPAPHPPRPLPPAPQSLSPPPVPPLSLTKVAFVIRGLIFKRNSQPAGGRLHPTSDHDLLRSAWPSMLENLVMPARLCGFDVRIHIVMHPNSRARMDDTYIHRLRAIDSSASIWTVPADTPDSQFDVPRAFLLQQFDASAYQLVVMTRDDMVYRPGSWDALSSRYDPGKLNIVSTDCSNHVWDGFHVFPASEAAVFARAFTGKWAHGLVSSIALEETGQLNVWFTGMYAQPDECEPAMGYLDRGDQSIHDRFPTLSEQNQYSEEEAGENNHCCAVAHQELDSLRGLRSCPILSQLPPARPEPPFPPAPPKPPPRIPSSYVVPRSTYPCCSESGPCENEYMRPDDPHHPACELPKEPRFALVLHGMVSKLSGKTVTSDSDEDYDSTNFVDPVPVYQHFVRFLMEPSGGVSKFDVFMHTATPSQLVRHMLANIYQPISANFTARYHSEWKPMQG